MSAVLGFLGNGNMGFAILKGLVESRTLAPQDIAVYDLMPAIRERAAGLGCQIYESECALAEASTTVLAAIKPQHAAHLFQTIGQAMTGKLLVSIVAGFEAAAIRRALGNDQVRIQRVMPNTPAMVGAGVFGLDVNATATAEEKQMVAGWLGTLGSIEWIDESLFPVITALSGGGPAFVAMFIEALADGGVKQGLRRDAALRIAAQTVLGSAKMVVDTGMHPAVVKDMVCSPAGTTIEGVQALEEGNFRATVMKCIEKSTEKALHL